MKFWVRDTRGRNVNGEDMRDFYHKAYYVVINPGGRVIAQFTDYSDAEQYANKKSHRVSAHNRRVKKDETNETTD